MSASSIDEVIDQLDEIIVWSIENGSRLGYFPALYRRVTAEIRDRIAAGYFDDAERMTRFDIIFANRYLDAFAAYRRGEPCTDAWRLAFDSSQRWSPIVLQHLLLGMNAHISLDLGITAAQSCDDCELDLLQADFNRINEVLAELVDEVQRELAGIWPPLRLLDWLAGRLDEALSDFAMEIARDAAWQMAQEYTALETPQAREAYIRQRDAEVTRFGEKLAAPGWLMKVVVFVIRMGELGSTGAKVRRLNRAAARESKPLQSNG
jgi:hypothetical protein